MIAIVSPPPASAPRCAAASMPNAPPETTAQPGRASPSPSRPATASPYGVALREPTTATARANASSSRGAPSAHSASGGVSSDHVLGTGAARTLPVVRELHRPQRLVRPLAVLRRDEPGAEPARLGQVARRPGPAAAAPRPARSPGRPRLPARSGPHRLHRPDLADEVEHGSPVPAPPHGSTRPGPAATSSGPGRPVTACRPCGAQGHGLIDVRGGRAVRPARSLTDQAIRSTRS